MCRDFVEKYSVLTSIFRYTAPPHAREPLYSNSAVIAWRLQSTSAQTSVPSQKRSPDLLNKIKIGHGQLRLIIKTYFVLPYMGMVTILVK